MEAASAFRKKLGTSDTIYKLRRKRVQGHENHPVNIVIIDEFWRVVHHQQPKNTKDATSYDTLMHDLKALSEAILREGRSYGMFLLTITQSPRAEEQKLSGAQDSYAWKVYGAATENMAQTLKIPELFTDKDLDSPGYFYFTQGPIKPRKFRVPFDQ